MKRHVLSQKYQQYLNYALFMIKCHTVKVLVSTVLLYAVRILYFSEAIDKFSQAYPETYKVAF